MNKRLDILYYVNVTLYYITLCHIILLLLGLLYYATEVRWLQVTNYTGHIYFDTFPRNEELRPACVLILIIIIIVITSLTIIIINILIINMTIINIAIITYSLEPRFFIDECRSGLVMRWDRQVGRYRPGPFRSAWREPG